MKPTKAWLLSAVLCLTAARAHAQDSMTIWLTADQTIVPDTEARIGRIVPVVRQLLENAPPQRIRQKSFLAVFFNGPKTPLAMREERKSILVEIKKLWEGSVYIKENGRTEIVEMEDGEVARGARTQAPAVSKPPEFKKAHENVSSARRALETPNVAFDNNKRRADGGESAQTRRGPTAHAAPGSAQSINKGKVEACIRSAAYEFKLNPDLLRAISQVKSGFDPNLVNGSAVGLMGVTRAAALSVGDELGYRDPDLHSACVNSRIGAKILTRIFATKGIAQNVSRALAAYQVGTRKVINRQTVSADDRIIIRRLHQALGGLPESWLEAEPAPEAPTATAEAAPKEVPAPATAAPEATAPKAPTAQAEAADAAKAPSSTHGANAVIATVSAVIAKVKHVLGQGVAYWMPTIMSVTAKYDNGGVSPMPNYVLAAAVMRVESEGNPDILGKAGERGPMQLLPATAKVLGVKDISNPVETTMAATRHLMDLLRQYKSPELALRAYNGGDRGVANPKPSTLQYVMVVLAWARKLAGEITQGGAQLSQAASELATASPSAWIHPTAELPRGPNRPVLQKTTPPQGVGL